MDSGRYELNCYFSRTPKHDTIRYESIDKTDFKQPKKAISDEQALHFDDEDRGYWSDRYKEENGFRPTQLSNHHLISWANDNFTLEGNTYVKK